VATFQVTEIDEAADRRRRMRRAGFWSFLGVAALAVGGALTWYLTPPAMPTTVAEAEALVSSPRFNRLSKKQKQPYQDVIREQFGSLDREKRRAMAQENQELAQALREARHVQMAAFARKFALADPSERAALLEEMPRRGPGGRDRGARPEGEGGRPDGGEGARPERGGADGDGPSPEQVERMRERMNRRATEGSSQTSQLMSEIRRASGRGRGGGGGGR